MATVITGRDVSVTIDAVTYDPQTLEARLNQTEDRQRWDTIAAAVHKVLDVSGTFTLRMLADWGEDAGGGTSLCGALWDAVTNSPDTSVAVTFTANGDSWAGNVFPSHPDDGPGGVGKDGQEIGYTFDIDPETPFVRTAAAP